MAKKIFHREQLYSDFISESGRLLIEALEHNAADPLKIITGYALLSRVRLSSSAEVLKAAEELSQHILGAYARPNLTPAQIQARATNGDDPLKHFSEVCRVELDSMQKQI